MSSWLSNHKLSTDLGSNEDRVIFLSENISTKYLNKFQVFKFPPNISYFRRLFPSHRWRIEVCNPFLPPPTNLPFFVFFFWNFFTFQKRNVFAQNVFHGCIFPCEESFFQSHTKSYWQKLFFIFRGEESMCATFSSATTGLFISDFFLYFYKDMPCFSHFCEQIFSYSFKTCFTFFWWSYMPTLLKWSGKYFSK